MTRSMNHLQRGFTEFHFITFFQIPVGQGRLFYAEAIHRGGLFHAFQKKFIITVGEEGNPISFFHPFITEYMIEMAMGVEQ